MKIIFMGTPYFAVPTLEKLLASEHDVIAVYTKEPKKAGRGQNEIKSPIHQLAEAHNIKVFTPKTLRGEEALQEFNALQADVAVVAAYGLLLPKAILESTKYGCINLHPSKLPRWRGAAPIQHTILSGDKETAICIMQMDEGMDTGDILMQRELPVPAQMTAAELHDLASHIGADMMIETLNALQLGGLDSHKQSEEGATHARKINRDDEKLDWGKSSFLVNCQIRTFSPKPGAYFTYSGENIKVLEAQYDDSLQHNYVPGEVIDDNLSIACAHGVLKPTLLQREGRKMIYVEAFLRGFQIPKGVQLG